MRTIDQVYLWKCISHHIYIWFRAALVSWPPTVYISFNPSPKPVYSRMWDGGGLLLNPQGALRRLSPANTDIYWVEITQQLAHKLDSILVLCILALRRSTEVWQQQEVNLPLWQKHRAETFSYQKHKVHYTPAVYYMHRHIDLWGLVMYGTREVSVNRLQGRYRSIQFPQTEP